MTGRSTPSSTTSSAACVTASPPTTNPRAPASWGELAGARSTMGLTGEDGVEGGEVGRAGPGAGGQRPDGGGVGFDGLPRTCRGAGRQEPVLRGGPGLGGPLPG